MQQTTKEQAAVAQRAALGREQEFMSLAPGVGIIPDEYRNRGYRKLDFGPGEGGLSGLLDSKPAATDEPSVREVLAALASGANPQQYAKQLLGEQTRGRRSRQTATTEEA